MHTLIKADVEMLNKMRGVCSNFYRSSIGHFAESNDGAVVNAKPSTQVTAWNETADENRSEKQETDIPKKVMSVMPN